jgi:hypothetical protein
VIQIVIGYREDEEATRALELLVDAVAVTFLLLRCDINHILKSIVHL